MFIIHITLYDGRSFAIPVMRHLLPSYVQSDGYINVEGIKFLTSQFYFLNQINFAMLRCNDFKSLFMLYAHKQSFRKSITFSSFTKTVKMSDTSKIFNYTFIKKDNMLTPEGCQLVFGPGEFNTTALISITNYNTIYTEYIDYCKACVAPPPVHQPSFGFGFGSSVLVAPPTPFFGFTPQTSTTQSHKFNGFGNGFGSVNLSDVQGEPSTPTKKHKNEDELVCPDAPKKTRKDKSP